MNLAKTGFVEGETIMANVGINNQSNRVMEESTCKLLQKVTYSSGDKKKVSEKPHIMHEAQSGLNCEIVILD